MDLFFGMFNSGKKKIDSVKQFETKHEHFDKNRSKIIVVTVLKEIYCFSFIIAGGWASSKKGLLKSISRYTETKVKIIVIIKMIQQYNNVISLPFVPSK